jgi:hypothetical protein
MIPWWDDWAPWSDLVLLATYAGAVALAIRWTNPARRARRRRR